MNQKQLYCPIQYSLYTCLQTNGLQDFPQSGFYRIVLRKLGRRLAVAVAAVYALILRQNAQQLQTVLFNFLPNAGIQHTAGRTVYDQAHTVGF